MSIPEIPTERALPLAELTLANLHEVLALVERPPVPTEEMLATRLTPRHYAAAHLVIVRDLLEKEFPLPSMGGENATMISRGSVLFLLKPRIRELSAFIVQVKNGAPPSPTDCGRILLIIAVAVVSLLAAKETFPQISPDGDGKEVAKVGMTDAAGFRGPSQ